MKIFLIFIIVVGLVIGVIFIAKSVTDKSDSENSNAFTVTEIVTGAADLQIKAAADKDLAIAKAMELWRAKFIMGEDLSSGPCLSNEVVPGWVADIAHNPRQSVDDEPANQCSAYRDGTAKHFVEIDPAGNLIKAQ